MDVTRADVRRADDTFGRRLGAAVSLYFLIAFALVTVLMLMLK
jgi:hypothetical protein